MRKFKLLFLVAMVASLAFSSCKKYEEGPSLTLRSRESRLAGEWKITKSFQNGVAKNFNVNDREKFEKGGVYTKTENFIQPIVSSGTWEFTSDDENLTLVYTTFGATFTKVWTIMRLSSKELFIERKDGNDLYRMEYEKL